LALPESAKELIRSGALGHLVTIGDRGAPQVTCVWVAVDGDDVLTAHLNPQQRKLDNVRRDSRVAVSFEGSAIRPPGLREYLVVHGNATIEEGGAPELLQELARVYLDPDVRFPPMDDPPTGVRMRIAVERVSGIGPWAH
jgi:PPOX class probable F420-dependent enzyme